MDRSNPPQTHIGLTVVQVGKLVLSHLRCLAEFTPVILFDRDPLRDRVGPPCPLDRSARMCASKFFATDSSARFNPGPELPRN